MDNILNKKIEYKISHTSLGEWHSYMYSTGAVYNEFISHIKVLDLPLIHYTSGRCPETGRYKAAKGIIAIGKIAFGIIAIGQFSAGVISIGQISLALLAIAQVGLGIISIGQLSIAAYLAIGQFALGYISIGQFAFGYYVLAQFGFGEYVWSVKNKDPHAIEFFKMLFGKIRL